MADMKNKDVGNRVLKERDPRKNFDEIQFVADMVLFFCERAVEEVKIARRNEEMTAVCNLYSMINLTELREIAKFNCDFGLIDEYRDIILKKTEHSLHMIGIRTSSTYKFNPYMACTFTAACADMDAAELDRLGNGFTTKDEFKRTCISVFLMVFVNVAFQSVLLMFRIQGAGLPAFMSSGWPQLALAAVTVSGSAAAMAYYFRRCIASYAAEWRVRRRLSRAAGKKADAERCGQRARIKAFR